MLLWLGAMLTAAVLAVHHMACDNLAEKVRISASAGMPTVQGLDALIRSLANVFLDIDRQ